MLERRRGGAEMRLIEGGNEDNISSGRVNVLENECFKVAVGGGGIFETN